MAYIFTVKVLARYFKAKPLTINYVMEMSY